MGRKRDGSIPTIFGITQPDFSDKVLFLVRECARMASGLSLDDNVRHSMRIDADVCHHLEGADAMEYGGVEVVGYCCYGD